MQDERNRELLFREEAKRRSREREEVRQRSPIQLHAHIRSSISRGVVDENERLDEDSLVQTYSTSRNSVRAALTLLATEGIVSRGPRNGTFVKERIEELPLGVSGSGWEDGPERHTLVRLSRAEIPVTPLIRDALKTDSDTVVVTQWVDLRDGRPCLIYITYIIGEVERPLTRGTPDEPFETLFAKAYGSPLARVDTSIQAVSSDERTGRLLEVPTGTMLLLKERLLWDAAGIPREFSHTYYVASRTALTATTWTESAVALDIPAHAC